VKGRETYQFDVHRIGVRFTVNGYGLDAELSCCSDYPTCDLTTIRNGLLRWFRVRAIGDVPVGYKDLVEVRFAMRRAPKMVRLVTNASSRSAPGDTKRLLLTCRREVPRNPGKVRAGNHRRAIHNGGSRGNPRRGMG